MESKRFLISAKYSEFKNFLTDYLFELYRSPIKRPIEKIGSDFSTNLEYVAFGALINYKTLVINDSLDIVLSVSNTDDENVHIHVNEITNKIEQNFSPAMLAPGGIVASKKFKSAFAIYTTQAIVGEGGSGVVYKALDENNNIVAIKCLDLKKSTKEKQKRFKNEINFCVRNIHKNIVTITDYGIHAQGKENTMFYVMPNYSSTLRKLMDEKIKADKVLVYFSQILDGLEAAHLKSIWHRDIKPENILYDLKQDTLVIADFGIAHFEEEFLKTSVETKKGSRLANFRYAAPEQRGGGGKVDQRADLFSLGMVLYEMYTGLLLQGTGHKKVAEIAPDYAYVDNLIEELTRQSPMDRPSSIDEVKKKLIGHKNDFVSRQRLDVLTKTVVPDSEINDPLVMNPIKILEVDYREGNLIFTLNQNTTTKWETALKEIGNFTFIPGEVEPGLLRFSKNTVMIKVPSYRNPDQQIVDMVKDYISKGNSLYAERARIEHQGRLQQEKEQLRLKVEEEKKRQEFHNKLKL